MMGFGGNYLRRTLIAYMLREDIFIFFKNIMIVALNRNISLVYTITVQIVKEKH